MLAALPSIPASLASEKADVSHKPAVASDNTDVVETRLWLEEHQWLLELMQHPTNAAPKFRMPDLISACVSLVFIRSFGVRELFEYLGTELVLRSPRTPRRKEALWRTQYELLLAIQLSAANQHPNPKFQLDQLTTACVALARKRPDATYNVLHQARINMADRTGRWRFSKDSVPQPPTADSNSDFGLSI
jgi:hypothetical protein